VEYNGCHVHPKPTLTEDKQQEWTHAFSGETFEERLKKDLAKIQTAKNNGFKVFVIWNDEDPEKIIKEILKETIK